MCEATLSVSLSLFSTLKAIILQTLDLESTFMFKKTNYSSKIVLTLGPAWALGLGPLGIQIPIQQEI